MNQMIADKVLINGKIFSIAGDDTIIRGSGVAVKDGMIVDIFKSDTEAEAYIGSDTQVINCNGNTILPGLCDGHAHPSLAANFYVGCSLFEIVSSPENTSRQMIERYKAKFKKYIAENPDREIYRGIGWNRAVFSGACKNPEWPTRHDLDEICADKPVILESYCQHAIWTNTKAIELAGLDAGTPNPETGEMYREADGYPSGIFMEFEAIGLIKDHIQNYDYTVEQYKTALKEFQQRDASYFGITLVDDCYCTENAMQAYKELADSNELTLRCRGVYKIEETGRDPVAQIAERHGSDHVNDLYQVNTIKIFVEGEIAMLEPYAEEAVKELGLPENYCGDTFWPDEEAYSLIEACIKTGMQVHIHAMGDKAVRQAVRGLAEGQKKTGIKNRNVIAHLMAVTQEDIRIMADNDIIGNVQPRWMVYETDAEDFYSASFGRKRALDFWPNKRLSDAGCIVAYGTDFPVSPPPNPYQEIQCAMTRSVFEEDVLQYPKYHSTIYGPDEDPTRDCVSFESAIKSLTYNGAYQNFLEHVTGSIEKGKSAELVILTCDIESIPVEEIHKVKVDKTIFKGNIVYDAQM